MMHRRHSRFAAAFTLIELLVVIAIVSLLVSILVPSLTVAKDMAKAVLCANNLKALFMSITYYCENKNQYLPIYIVPVGMPQDRGSNWHRNIWAYVEDGGTYDSWGQRYIDVIDSQGAWIYQCPAAEPPDEYYSFAMNRNLMDERTQMSAKVLLLMDFFEQSLAVGSLENIEYRMRGWHPGETNSLLFEDGHWEARTLDEIPPRNEDRDLWYHQ